MGDKVKIFICSAGKWINEQQQNSRILACAVVDGRHRGRAKVQISIVHLSTGKGQPRARAPELRKETQLPEAMKPGAQIN
jgi:hypothetical protein